MSGKQLKIGFITREDLGDKLAWSGTIASMAEALSRRHVVVPIRIPCDTSERLARGVDFLLSGRRIRHHGPFWQCYTALRLRRSLAQADCDLYFSPGQSDMLSLCLPKGKKLIYLYDCVFRSVVNYYFFGLDQRTEAYLDSADARMLDRADAVILSSRWAKRDALRFYHVPEEKISVLHFGANLRDAYQGRAFPAGKRRLKILLVGVEWERKGVDIAIRCVEALNRLQTARRFELTIVGFSEPKGRDFPGTVHFAGRLNKNVPAEYAKIVAYYQESDIFLLPTRAECSAIVFGEASEYGLPIFTHRTGGVEDYVEDGATGRCLAPGSTGEDFARAILAMLEAGAQERFSRRAREKYERDLNWDTWLAGFERVLAGL